LKISKAVSTLPMLPPACVIVSQQKAQVNRERQWDSRTKAFGQQAFKRRSPDLGAHTCNRIYSGLKNKLLDNV
jgi:hypothetical protein